MKTSGLLKILVLSALLQPIDADTFERHHYNGLYYNHERMNSGCTGPQCPGPFQVLEHDATYRAEKTPEGLLVKFTSLSFVAGEHAPVSGLLKKPVLLQPRQNTLAGFSLDTASAGVLSEKEQDAVLNTFMLRVPDQFFSSSMLDIRSENPGNWEISRQDVFPGWGDTGKDVFFSGRGFYRGKKEMQGFSYREADYELRFSGMKKENPARKEYIILSGRYFSHLYLPVDGAPVGRYFWSADLKIDVMTADNTLIQSRTILLERYISRLGK